MADTVSDRNVAATKYAYNNIHEQYVSSNLTLNDTVRQNLDHFIASLSGKTVLDVGCAGGREPEYLHTHGLTVTGCDISEEFIRVAEKRCPDCAFFVADMRHIESPPDTYDGIWANSSFLHIPKTNASATLKNFHSMLKEQGVLYISVMQGDFDSLRENKQMKWPERHFSDYQPDELKNLLLKTGFEIINESSNTTHWGPTFLHFFAKKVG
ncbi:MAG: ubiquinone/menaquinone biosynthesis methyltransferase UbiE [Patescibacteria group bacterium]|nr:ubiquinone/menaquinone biosynthesis methyltransferase UbiE [Patescibacteria group bacterium]